MKLLLALLPLLALSHFALTWPPSRHYGSQITAGTCQSHKDLDLPGRNGTCLWFSNYCMIGCEFCSANETDWNMGINTGCKEDMGQPIEGILTDEHRTWWNFTLPKESDENPTYGKRIQFDMDMSGISKSNPWFYPGKAPIFSPCGMAGGGPAQNQGCPGDGAYNPHGIQQGFDGRNLPPNPDANNVWERGSLQEVSFELDANHGGGDSYRLCKKADAFHFETEECFQAGALNFHGDKSWIQFGGDKENRVEIDAKRWVVDGQMWSRNPIPACGNVFGGNSRGMGPNGVGNPGQIQSGPECLYPQFEPPIEGLFGMGRSQCVFPILGTAETPTYRSNVGGYFPDDVACTEEKLAEVTELWNFSVVDLVEIPEDLEPGEYVLSWRHDSEQTPQVWANCADITIV